MSQFGATAYISGGNYCL